MFTKVVLKRFIKINAMLCSCLVVIFFTSFVQGASIGPIVEWLKVKREDTEKRGMDEEVVYRAIDHLGMSHVYDS